MSQGLLGAPETDVTIAVTVGVGPGTDETVDTEEAEEARGPLPERLPTPVSLGRPTSKPGSYRE